MAGEACTYYQPSPSWWSLESDLPEVTQDVLGIHTDPQDTASPSYPMLSQKVCFGLSSVGPHFSSWLALEPTHPA